MKKDKLAAVIDHTILGADIGRDAVIEVCKEVCDYGFASVCIEPYYVSLVRKKLQGSGVKTCTVIGFPLGNTTTETKAAEAKKALNDGAEELDMVINISALKNKEYDFVKNDIQKVVEISGEALVKVIIETCYLTNEEKVIACQLAEEAGADFVKTSTGFGSGGATAEDVKLMHDTVGKSMSIKASGGIRTYEDALAMIGVGADRLGASSGIKIVKGAEG